GEQSDAAIVLTTLVLAAAFTPIKDRLQKAADRRFGQSADPTSRLRAFNEQVQSFVQMTHPVRLTRHALEEAVSALRATGGAVHLDRGGHRLTQTCGRWDGDAGAVLT